MPPDRRREFERLYPFVWIGVLSPTPPVNDELIYANHPDGFALCSMRNENLSRYYVQGAADDSPEDWPDERFWEALRTRLPEGPAERLVTAPTLETIVTPLRSWVMEPMRHGRLLLAGDAAHLVPPTGAKGLNLAISDVVYLAQAIADFYDTGSSERLDTYSDTALARVWKAVRFSWWMTQTMHRFPGIADDFDRRLQETELRYLFQSENAQKALAENYVGLPLCPEESCVQMTRFEDGMEVRRRVLGDDHVDTASQAMTDLDRDFQTWITENVWGGVWTRPGLDLKTRSMITIAILGALGHEELSLHLRAARNTGVGVEEITEILLHVAVYGGVPAANRAFKVTKQIYEEGDS